MKKIFTIGAIIIIVILGFWFWKLGAKPETQNNIASSTSSVLGFDQNIFDGTIKMAYPSKGFGLATNPQQILVKSYIPSCSENFNYCLYFNSSKYQGTNFESAGVRVLKRTDLTDEKLCLNTAPAGFDASMTPSSTKSTDQYSSSIFANVGDAAAGHYAIGSLYRLYAKNDSSCYELETRIGQSQFANYPAGAIKEFTADDMKNLQSELAQIMEQITLPSGEKNLWPIFIDYKNATYLIESQSVTLTNGRAESTSAPGSASKTVTQYFGNEVKGDLNGDGLPDVAFIITQNSGGSGTFYYAVAALKTKTGYRGSNAVLLGDRIAPQSTEIKNGQLIVNYADRKAREPMTVKPSVSISKYLKIQGASLIEVK
jgi:hypothetical protein